MTLPSYSTPFIEVAPPQRRPLQSGLFQALGPGAVHDLPRLAGHSVGVGYESVNCNRPIGVLPVPCSTDQPPLITAITCELDDSTQQFSAEQQQQALAGVFEQDIVCDCGNHLSYGAPFMLYASACVNPLESEQVVRDRATQALEVGASRGVERIFATVLPRLAQDVTPAACQCGIVGAVAALEGQIASSYDGTGVIHAPAFAAAYICTSGLLADTDPLRTRLGTRFAFGGGYSGDGPDDEAATDCTFWMYVTPDVDIWRGNVSVPYVQSTDHNTTLAVAQQPYAITIDCGGVYGTRVNVDPTCA